MRTPIYSDLYGKLSHLHSLGDLAVHPSREAEVENVDVLIHDMPLIRQGFWETPFSTNLG